MLSEERVFKILKLIDNLPTGHKYDSIVYVLRVVLKIILEMNSEKEMAWLKSWTTNTESEKKEGDIEK